MAARQYLPFSTEQGGLPLIVYPVKDENPLEDVFDRKDKKAILNHIQDLYQRHKAILQKGSYHILFVWNLEKHRMTDVWVYDMKNWSDSGPLLECHTFRDLEVTDDAGIASGDSVIVLGREEELRRKVGELKQYVDRAKHLPTFPEGFAPTETF